MEIRGKGLSFILALVLVLNLIVLVSLGLEYVGASGLTRLQWFSLGGTGIAALLSLRAFNMSSELRSGLRRRDTLMRLLWLD
jgi:hypothetical protein